MKVETPQILWNAEGDKSVNAALYSVSMVQSGIVDPTAAASDASRRYGNVLATAGNSPLINLWKVAFPPTPPPIAASAQSSSSSSSSKDNNNKNANMMYQRHERGNSSSNNNQSPPKTNGNNNSIANNNNNNTKIEYLCSLSRHEGAVNCVAFSPDGLHLATAGDKSGGVIVYSVPINKRGNGNGCHFWSTVTRESDLTLRIIHCCSGDGVVDLSWSSDSKRFLVGTIDSAVLVCEDSSYAANHPSLNSPQQQPQQIDSAWKVVYRSKEHTHFVQGVSYDPLGVYLTSMSNDRSVRIYPRKTPPKSKKKVLRPTLCSSSSSNGNSSSGALAAAKVNSSNSINNNNAPSALPPADHARMVDNLLTESKLEVGKSKQIKQRKILVDETTGTIIKHNLFADESTLESFFRRLSWTADGAFLVTPAVLWHPNPNPTMVAAASSATGAASSTSPPSTAGASGAPSYATCLYARHHFDQPYKVFSGLEKPSLVVRPNPVLFQLPDHALVEVATKENAASSLSPKNNASTLAVAASSSSSSSGGSPAASLPYKSIFCVLTNDSVVIYDTHHDTPLSVVRGLHYSNLSDATWSQDGHSLLVCSTDGYLSILRFAPAELGKVYTAPSMENEMPTTMTSSISTTVAAALDGGKAAPPIMMVRSKKSNLAKSATSIISNNNKPLPPCEPGSEAVLEEPPQKRSKTCHSVTAPPPTAVAAAVAASCASNNKRPASVALGELETGNDDDDHDETVKAVDNLSLDNDKNVASAENDNPAASSRPVVIAKKKKRVQPILLSSA